MRNGLEISTDMLALQDLLESGDVDFDDPQIQNEICKWAETLDAERITKADNISALITEWQARANFRRQEADRLTRRASVDDNNAKRLKGYLHYLFEVWGIKKMQTPRYSISIANNGGKAPIEISPEILNTPEILPECYRILKYEINKDAIRDSILAGNEVIGCSLRDRGQNLRIR